METDMESKNNNPQDKKPVKLSKPEKLPKSKRLLKPEEQKIAYSVQAEAIKEYAELYKRYPRIQGRRKGIRRELEKLAVKYPGAVFPGYKRLNTGITTEELRISRLAIELETVIGEKHMKRFPTPALYKSAIKVLEVINKSVMTKRSVIRDLTGLSASSVLRAAKLLINLGFIKSYLGGKFHYYGILEEGRNFLQSKE